MELRDCATVLFIHAQATNPYLGLFICCIPPNSLSTMVDTEFRGAAGVVSPQVPQDTSPLGFLLISLPTSRV